VGKVPYVATGALATREGAASVVVAFTALQSTTRPPSPGEEPPSPDDLALSTRSRSTSAGVSADESWVVATSPEHASDAPACAALEQPAAWSRSTSEGSVPVRSQLSEATSGEDAAEELPSPSADAAGCARASEAGTPQNDDDKTASYGFYRGASAYEVYKQAQWLSDVSLLMRTHLNGIMGMNQLVGCTPVSIEQSLYVHIIHISAEALLNEISDVIDKWDILGDSHYCNTQPFSMVGCAEEAMDMVVRSAAQKTSLETLAFLDPCLAWEVEGDPQMIKRTVLKLAAFFGTHATQLEGLMLSVRQEDCNDKGFTACFELSAYSSGGELAAFKEHTARDLRPWTAGGGGYFDSPVDGSFAPWLARRLVQRMSGSTVDSGAESRLVFTLPMRWAKKSTVPTRVAVQPNTSKYIMQPSVLLVDTMPPFRSALRHYCEVWGFRVVAVDTLSAARAELRNAFFTVLLISLPSNASDDLKPSTQPSLSPAGAMDPPAPSRQSSDSSDGSGSFGRRRPGGGDAAVSEDFRITPTSEEDLTASEDGSEVAAGEVKRKREPSNLPVDFEEILDLKSAGELEGTSVVVMSSVNKHNSIMAHPSVKQGLWQVLPKPVTAQRLAFTLEEVLTDANKPEASPSSRGAGTNSLEALFTHPDTHDGHAPRIERRILVADDHPINQKLVCWIMQSAGIQTAVAHDGQQAIEMFHQSDFDLVLLDINMPHMSGVEVAEEIRRCEARGTYLYILGRVPIIGMSAQMLLSDMQSSYADSGMDDFLSFPVDRHALLQKVETWIVRGRTSANPCIQIGRILDMCSDERSVAVKMLEGLVRMAGMQIGEMRNALITEHFIELVSGVEAIVSVSKRFGAPWLARAANQLKQHLLAEGYNDRSSKLATISLLEYELQFIGKCTDELKKFLREADQGPLGRVKQWEAFSADS
jgi:CheY-like chemotaxis protein